MTKVFGALYSFFSGFGLPAWAENDVPDGAALPYITVKLTAPDWTQNGSIYVRVWYRSRSFVEVAAKAGEIWDAIGAGAVEPFEGGSIWIYRDGPGPQHMAFEGDPDLKCMYLPLQLGVNA